MSENDKHSFLNSLKVTQEAGLPKTDLQKEQEEMHNVLLSYLDTYEDKNSIKAKKYLCYLTAAIYLTYRNMYPNLVTRIPFRTKADLSYMKNIQKEFIKSIVEYLNNCSEYGKTFTLENFEQYFPTDSTTKDIQAATILLDHFREPILHERQPMQV